MEPLPVLFFQAVFLHNVFFMKCLGGESFWISKQSILNYRKAIFYSIILTAGLMAGGSFAFLLYRIFLMPLHLTFLFYLIYTFFQALTFLLAEGHRVTVKQSFFSPELLSLLSFHTLIAGTAFFIMQHHFKFIEVIFYTLGLGTGLGLSLILFICLYQRLSETSCPKPFTGYPIMFISFGIISMALSLYW